MRPGKVYVDWAQNERSKTTACAYSLRAMARPTASTPVTWDEVAEAAEGRDPSVLSFEAEEVLGRVAERGDLFEPVLTLKQRLPKI
jgi:bifunctional non-homologous end joining protein LigD